LLRSSPAKAGTQRKRLLEITHIAGGATTATWLLPLQRIRDEARLLHLSTNAFRYAAPAAFGWPSFFGMPIA